MQRAKTFDILSSASEDVSRALTKASFACGSRPDNVLAVQALARSFPATVNDVSTKAREQLIHLGVRMQWPVNKAKTVEL